MWVIFQGLGVGQEHSFCVHLQELMLTLALLLTNFARQIPPSAHIFITPYISLITVFSFDIDFNMSFTKKLFRRVSATSVPYLALLLPTVFCSA